MYDFSPIKPTIPARYRTFAYSLHFSPLFQEPQRSLPHPLQACPEQVEGLDEVPQRSLDLTLSLGEGRGEVLLRNKKDRMDLIRYLHY